MKDNKNKLQKKILCPYCKNKFKVKDMPIHLGDNHDKELPEGFTPLQVTYHIYNKYPFEYRRKCRVCKKPTSWDENKGRYNFLCDNPSCKKEWIKIMKKNIGDKNLTSSPEGLEKMLAGRRISGVYKYSTGEEFTYTGSYELECLKFFDKVINAKAEDLMVPGPIMTYKFNGEDHYYITDMLYVPYNLIIEVKDGGDNPNKKNMLVSRAKQIAKEKYIIEETNYNYLRLTNNNFSQLLIVFADLKMHVKDNDTSRIIHVNEDCASMNGMMLPAPNFNDTRDIVIVNYLKHNTFVDDLEYAICDNPKFDTVFVRDNGKLIKTDKSIFEGCSYTPYIVRNIRSVVEDRIADKLGQFISKDYLYESVFDHPAITSDQIIFEKTAELYGDYYNDIKNLSESIKEDIYDTDNIVQRRWGIISDNGAYNCCLKIRGYDKPMRGRSAMLILKKFGFTWKCLLNKKKEKREYEAPGGGWNEDESPKDAAIREAREEVRINVKDVKYEGHLIEYHEKVADWVKNNVDEKDWWYGYFTEIFVGLYDSKYNGEIADTDKDEMINKAKWYSVKDLVSDKSFLCKEYKNALIMYMGEMGYNY